MAIRGRFKTQLPATLQGDGGIAVSKVNGIWTIEPDWSALALEETLPEPEDRQLWVYDPGEDTYLRLSMQGLIDALPAGPAGEDGEDGATGATGATGPGYAATSVTSNAIASSGSKTFTTQAGLAYTAGARVRAADAALPATNWMEGVVTSYSGTTLTFTADKSLGSGTLTSWTINLAGQPGADGAGVGDLISTNNLSDVDDAEASIANLGIGRCTSRTILKALTTATTKIAVLTETGRDGVFHFKAGDYSTHITADTEEGVYIKADDTAAASGAWVRVREPRVVDVAWFGALPAAADNTTAIQAAIDFCGFELGGRVYFGGYYEVASEIIVDSDDVILEGRSKTSGLFRETDGRVLQISALRCGMYSMVVNLPVFTSTATSYALWINDAVQFYMENCYIQGGYHAMAITGGVNADNTFISNTFTFATGTALVYAGDSTDGVNGAHHFNRCTFNQGWPVGSPNGTTNFKGAHATTTAYVQNDVVIVGSYYLQCRVAGTSGGSTPTVNVWYGTDIADGATVKWRLVGHTSYAGLQFDTNTYYCTVYACDLTGVFQYAIRISDTLAGDIPDNIEILKCTAHGPISIGCYVQAGLNVTIDGFDTWNPSDNTATTYGVLVAGDITTIKNLKAFNFDHGVSIQAAYAKVLDSQFGGNATAITVGATFTRIWILNNTLEGSKGTATDGSYSANTAAYNIGASVDYYFLRNNVIGAASVTNGSSGASNKIIDGNL